MPHEMMMGLLVVNPMQYAQYRKEMTPLLEAAGGRFTYDFEVARVLKSQASHEINRVFVIRFPDRAAQERFFSDAEYLGIRKRLFEDAVAGSTVLAERD
jgi:uncharacterized protein (DUF1330 family)